MVDATDLHDVVDVNVRRAVNPFDSPTIGLPADIRGDIDVLTTHDGQLPLFFTHIGLAIAEDTNIRTNTNDYINYSASNIKYNGINGVSADTKMLLGLEASADIDFYCNIRCF